MEMAPINPINKAAQKAITLFIGIDRSMSRGRALQCSLYKRYAKYRVPVLPIEGRTVDGCQHHRGLPWVDGIEKGLVGKTTPRETTSVAATPAAAARALTCDI
jgi:hypothetical protein